MLKIIPLLLVLACSAAAQDKWEVIARDFDSRTGVLKATFELDTTSGERRDRHVIFRIKMTEAKPKPPVQFKVFRIDANCFENSANLQSVAEYDQDGELIKETPKKQAVWVRSTPRSIVETVLVDVCNRF